MAKKFWHISLSRKTEKSLGKRPKPVLAALALLLADIEDKGTHEKAPY